MQLDEALLQLEDQEITVSADGELLLDLFGDAAEQAGIEVTIEQDPTLGTITLIEGGYLNYTA
ncbi:MAG TPA: hypothetical protein DCP28_06075, partial [Cytophagales bacterium]|nr:hypothetical protein [Cytophagales bacterium]